MTTPTSSNPGNPFGIARLAALVFAVILAGALARAVLALPTDADGLTRAALAELSKSGVTNPVTAAVLNYRGYDTLLEIAVLLLALLGVWSIANAEPSELTPASRVLVSFVRFAVPLMILLAGYLLWIGAFAPGGAFQGGAVLGAAIVLLRLSGVSSPLGLSGAWLRVGLVLGLAVFVAVALAAMGAGGNLLEYPPRHAGTLIMLIESAALVSIGLTLAALFLGGRLNDVANSSNRSRSK